MKVWWKSFVVATLFFVAITAFSAMNPFIPVFSNPGVGYRIVSTKYINVVYEPRCEYAVNLFLKDGDEIYERVTDFYNFQPFSKLTVVFENDTNIVNSLADPVDNTIFIFLNSSAHGFFSQTMRSWVNFVFTHELTHILLTQIGGRPEARVYGTPLSTVYNSVFIPAYLQEGLAEYSETSFNDGHGRLNDPLFEMYMRGLVLSGRFKGLGGAATYSSDGWYPIGAPYMIGGSFIRYIVETYGATTLKRAVDVLSENHSLGVANAFSKVIKKPFSKIVSEWITKVKNDVSQKIKSIDQPLEGIRITHSGRWTALANVASDKYVYYYSESGDNVAQIKRLDISSARSSSVYEPGGFLYQGGYVRSIAVSPNGKSLIFTRFVAKDGGFHDYTQCFLLNLENHSVKELPLEGAISIAWFSDDEIVYSKESGGLYSIGEYKLKEGTFKTLVHPIPLVITSLSTFGKKVYLSANANGVEDIYELDGGKLYRIVTGNFLKSDPVVSKDGKYLTFSASKPDRNGIFNIYTVDLETGKFYKITNVTEGAFSPKMIGDKLFYAGYTKSGYDLFVIDRWKQSAKLVKGFTLSKKLYDPSINMTQVYLSVNKKSKPYLDALQTIGRGVMPLVFYDGTSLIYSLSGFDILRDRLGQNNFYALGNISTDKTSDNLIVGMINYNRYVLSVQSFLSTNLKSLSGQFSLPITTLFFERDALFYPTLGYTIEASGTHLSDKFEFSGVLEWNPSFIPNNPTGVESLYSQWKGSFSVLKPSTPTYNVTLLSALPFFSNVLEIGMNFKNDSIKFIQSLSFPRFHIDLYDVTGQYGLKYLDISQFSSYQIENGNIVIGVKSGLGFDSFLYRSFELNGYLSYDITKNKYKYGFDFDF